MFDASAMQSALTCPLRFIQSLMLAYLVPRSKVGVIF